MCTGGNSNVPGLDMTQGHSKVKFKDAHLISLWRDYRTDLWDHFEWL